MAIIILKINANVYTEILDNFLIPSIRVIFWKDNASRHKIKRIT